MLTGRQIALRFFVTLGIGAGLLALVWQVKGTWGSIVGTIGILIMIFAFKWLEQVTEIRAQAKAAAKKREEEARFINKSTKQPELFLPEQNPVLKKKLLRVFIGLTVIGFGVTWLGFQLKWPFLIVAFALPLGLWSSLIWASLAEKFKPEKPSHDFSFIWGTTPAFRRNIVLFGIAMTLSIVIGYTFTPPQPHAVPMIIGTFVAMFVAFLCQVFYIQFALQKEIEEWSLSEKRLERIMDVSIIILLITGYPVVQILLPNLIQELYFSMLFAGVGLIVGYFAHDYLKNKYTGFFENDERKWEILLKTYGSCIILTLCTAAIVNRRTADFKTESKGYKVTDKSATKFYLWLEIEGKNKRFEPKKGEWEKLEPGDSSKVLVGTGVLGFEYILKFEPRE
ncbi:MAG: hypothetical protein H7246_09545 [Phycisphaerae bacterium]|nr:hypothetical protein [Saprospiraceae bacterium]